MVKKRKNLKKKTILVTGGCGFIGAAITIHLVNEGYDVIVFDNNSRGKLSRLKNIINKIDFIKGDVRDYKSVFKIKKKIDIIIHLAYINGTKYFYQKPFDILDIAANGFINILKFSKERKIKNIFLASSSEVYQNPLQLPTKENEMLKIPDVHNPRYSYGGGKIFSEIYGLHFSKKYKKKFVIFRPHNVYGKDMGNEHVIPEIIKKFKKLKNKKEIKILGTGNEIRSFIHIKDFIAGFDKIFKKGKDQNIYNIGTTEKIKINKLVLLISKIFNKKVKIKKTKIPLGSPTIRCPDIGKIKKLGFKQKISLKEGIKNII